MRLYLVQVDATSLTDLRYGDRVTKGQKLGMDTTREAEVLAPAGGVVRHISHREANHVTTIHIISREDEKLRF